MTARWRAKKSKFSTSRTSVHLPCQYIEMSLWQECEVVWAGSRLSSSPPGQREGPVFTPYLHLLPVCKWVCPRNGEVLMTAVTPRTHLPRSQSAQSWGKQVEEATLNGSTPTSHTLPEEKKFWVRNDTIFKLLVTPKQSSGSVSFCNKLRAFFFAIKS